VSADPVPIAREPLTLERFLALPQQEAPTEVVDGQLVVTPSPLGPHQRIVSRLDELLNATCPPGYEALPGPVDWVLRAVPRLLVRQPDVLVVRVEDGDRLPLRRAPLLAVEVVSGDSLERDVITKRLEYARAGLPHYWVVDPRAGEVEVVIYRATASEGELLEVARARGDEPLTVDDPFAVTVTPSALSRPRRSG